MEADLPLLLASSVLVTVPWILSPGPVLAVTITKGYGSKMAGALIALGHGLIEFPLIFMFYFGLSELLDNPVIHKIISVFGGFIMIYLSLQTLRVKNVEINEKSKYANQSSFVAGLITTGGNPFFFITWVGIGSTLVHNLALFGIVAVLAFAIIHWMCDLLWSTFVSVTVFKSRRLWTPKVFRAVFIFCFIILAFFGLWFIVSAFL